MGFRVGAGARARGEGEASCAVRARGEGLGWEGGRVGGRGAFLRRLDVDGAAARRGLAPYAHHGDELLQCEQDGAEHGHLGVATCLLLLLRVRTRVRTRSRVNRQGWVGAVGVCGCVGVCGSGGCRLSLP